MRDEGQFRFTNGTLIDDNLEKERLMDVINHEAIHSILYSTTSYGQLVLMLEKSGLMDETSQMLTDVLFSYMNRMQERVALNIELMMKCVTNGMDEYLNAIDDLRNRNNVYYNHFRKLCCINGKINQAGDAKPLIDVLQEIARISLNIDLSKIPFDTFRSEKRVRRFFNDEKNNARFSPNKRFDILINILFRKNENNNDYNAICEGSIALEKMDDINYVHGIAMQAINKIFEKNPVKDRFIRRVESVGQKLCSMSPDMLALSVMPAKINENHTQYIKHIDSKEEFMKILEKQPKKYVYIMNRLRGFEEFQPFCIHEIQENTRISYTFATIESDTQTLYELLESAECHFVFYKTKFVDKEQKIIRKMVKQLPIYIYEDTPIIFTLDIIENMFYGGKYTYISRDHDTIVVFEKRSIILFSNIVSESEEVLDSELKKYKIEKTTPEDIGRVDELMYLDKICNDYDSYNKENIRHL